MFSVKISWIQKLFSSIKKICWSADSSEQKEDASIQRALDASTIRRIEKIFIKKNWPKGDEDPSGDGNLFDKFCDFFGTLNKEEQNLIFLLTECFERFTYFDYPRLYDGIFKNINSAYLNSHQNIYIVPLTSPSDIEQIKSGGAVTYIVRHTILPKFIDDNNHIIMTVSNVKVLNKRFPTRNDSLVIFVDDFVGTGDTAFKVYSEYQRALNTKIINEDVLIVSAVALEIGVNRLTRTRSPISYKSCFKKRDK